VNASSGSSTPYTLRGVVQLLGLSRHAVSKLIELGFVAPVKTPGGTWQFSFQDVVLLRSAHELRAARIPTRQILRSLRQLKARLPAEMPLAGLRIKAEGARVTVRSSDAHWEPDTGQLVLDLRIEPGAGSVSFLFTPQDRSASSAAADLGALFARAEALEATAPGDAESLYRQILTQDPAHAHAYLNLGFMLCEGGRCAEAADLYEAGVRHCGDDPLMHYNHAVALEGAGRLGDALASYEKALQLQPDLADAHQNAALLYAELGHKQLAIRHFSAFRRLQGKA
jgi:tetratricopeptide (TPR) repeat protein